MKDTDKSDLRVRKTQAAIKGAFKEMIMEMGPSKIQVKELAERAHIHRKTFYLHYSSIDALFEDVIQDIADAYYEKIDAIPPDMPMTEVNRVFFEYFSTAEPYVERLMCAPEYQELFDKTLRVPLMKHNRARYNPYSYLPQEEQNIINIFLTKSSNNMYRQWVADGKKIPLERIIELTSELLTHGISELAK
ncbi:MAG: TetR/AcrR family transcriptional regulator [Eubacteriales bacterium]|nr:TetR/AcrR family transcriptional regulator [Eubacteriales bacterium]